MKELEKLIEEIQIILDKGLDNMTRQDQHDLSKIIGKLYDLKAKTSALINEGKQYIKDETAKRTLELKITPEGEKKLTEIQIESIIHIEIDDMKKKVNTALAEYEMIDGKIMAAEYYRIDVRDFLKPIVYTDN